MQAALSLKGHAFLDMSYGKREFRELNESCFRQTVLRYVDNKIIVLP